jgi:gliding motility-associated-like protein
MKRLLSLLLVLLLHNFAFGQQMPDTASAVAWWPICGDMLDHRNHYDLISVNTSYTFDRFNSANSALYFDGVTSEAYYTTNIAIAPSFTYACWIYPTSIQNSIIFYNGDPSLNGFGLTFSNGAGGTGSKVSVLLGGGVAVDQLSTTVSLNAWHHVALVRSGNAYRLYVDLALQGAFAAIVGTPLSNRFTLGMDDVANTRHFEGRIDDIAIYSSPLSATQIGAMSQFNPVEKFFSLGTDSYICTGQDTLRPDSTFAQTYHKAWFSSVTTGVVDTADSLLAPVPPVNTCVTYQLNVSEVFGCVHSSTMNVCHKVFKVKLANDTAFCVGNCETLHATGGPTASYLWSTGSTADSLVACTTGSYSVFVDSGGCTARDTMNLTASPPPLVNLGADTSQCEGQPVLLQSTGGTYVNPTYLWSTFVSTPTITANSSGVYWLQVKDQGCTAADTIKVFIAYDTFSLYSTDTFRCHGDPYPVRMSAATGLSYQWTPTAGISSPTLATPTILADTSAEYYITVTIGSSVGSCIKRDSFFLDIQPNPISLNMGGNRFACRHDSLRLAPSVTPAWYTHYLYHWSPGGKLNDSTASVVTYISPTTDTEKIYLTVQTPGGCNTRDSMLIFVHTDSLADLDISMRLCQGTDSTLAPENVNLVEGPLTYAWHNGHDFVDSTSPTPTVQPHTSASYVGIITSKWGCHDTLKADVTILPQALIYMPDSVILHAGESYQISPTTNCARFTWYPGLGLTDTSISNPVATPVVNTRYIVKAITEDGCSLTDSIKISIDPLSVIDAPNAFVPGGLNSKFRVIRKGLAVLNYFRVFDRWGNMVYESKDIDAGWDGMYKNIPQPAGVYVYEIEAVTDLGKIFHKQGNVTLLR